MENQTLEAKVIIDNPDYEFVESKHTVKGTTLYVLKLKKRVEDKFKVVTRRVEKHGGYWSSQQRGFVFKRILDQKELNEIFKGIFFEEKIVVEEIDETKEAWMFTVDELMNYPYKKMDDNTFVFKYVSEGNPNTTYSIKVPSGLHKDAVKYFARQVISNAVNRGKYNDAVEKGIMKPERAALILKALDSSLFEIEEDFNISIHPSIRAVWNMKKSNEKEITDKLKYPFLFESSEMAHLSQERYSKIIYDAISSGKYESLIKDGVISANKAAFIIESAGFEIPEEILSEAIYERTKEVEQIIGGYADAQSIFDISEKHGVSVKEILKQFRKGIKVEREHTKDKKKMGEIIKDHLWENPLYYDVLLDAEKAMEEINVKDFSSNDEYLKALHDKQKEQDKYTDNEKAFLLSRPIIDKIKYAVKKIEAGVPEEVESFLRNEILNQFAIMFKDVVSQYISFTPIWLDLQKEFLTEKQKEEMLLFGVFNIANYDSDAVIKYIDNVLNSDLESEEGKKLNNIFELIPSVFKSDVPTSKDYELNPKDKGLAELTDAFVIKGKILSQNMGVFFSRSGVFASNFNIDIFIKGKKGYLSKLNIEEGVYGLSENSKDIFPIYGAKKLPMLKNQSHSDFFKKYMALYGNETKNLAKSTAIFTSDDIVSMYEDLTTVYNSKAYKQYFRKDVLGYNPLESGYQKNIKIVKTVYPILYLKMKNRIFSVSFDDMLSVVKASIQLDFDTVQFSASEGSLYISENVSAYLGFEETGLRVKIKGNEDILPKGILYYDLHKKQFYTNKLVEEKQIVDDKKEAAQKATLDDLNVRLRVLQKMIAKNPDNKNELEVRVRVLNKMIQKLSSVKNNDNDSNEDFKIGGTIGDSKAPIKNLKKINVNNYVWYLDPVKMIVYENEDGTGASSDVFKMTFQEREQVYDQMAHDKPMITH